MVAPLSDAAGAAQLTAPREPGAHPDAVASESALRSLQHELELAGTREARVRHDNQRLAKALEQAERQLAYLPTLREEAEVGRRTQGTAYRLQLLEHSLSWRVTRPMRSLSMEVRRVTERLRRR